MPTCLCTRVLLPMEARESVWFPKLELLVVVSCLAWVLGTKLGSFTKSNVHCWPLSIFPVPFLVAYMHFIMCIHVKSLF